MAESLRFGKLFWT